MPIGANTYYAYVKMLQLPSEAIERRQWDDNTRRAWHNWKEIHTVVIRIGKQIGCHTGGRPAKPSGFVVLRGSLTSHLVLRRVSTIIPRIQDVSSTTRILDRRPYDTRSCATANERIRMRGCHHSKLSSRWIWPRAMLPTNEAALSLIHLEPRAFAEARGARGGHISVDHEIGILRGVSSLYSWSPWRYKRFEAFCFFPNYLISTIFV